MTVSLLVLVPAGFGLVLLGWLLRDLAAPRPRAGGMVDFVPAAARGELDLDWSDPRRAGFGERKAGDRAA